MSLSLPSIEFGDFPDRVKKMVFCPLDENDFTEFSVQFNPSSLRLSRSVNWGGTAEAPKAPKEGATDAELEKHKKAKAEYDEKSSKPHKSNWEPLEWSGGQSDTLSFTLLLDQSEVRGTDGVTKTDNLNPFTGGISLLAGMLSFGEPETNDYNIIEEIEQLYALTVAYQGDSTEDIHSPAVKVSWGDRFIFYGAVTSLSMEIILFDADGNPRRATAEVSMKGRLDTTMMANAGGKVTDLDSLRHPEEPQTSAKSDIGSATEDWNPGPS